MAKLISEINKVDTAIQAQALVPATAINSRGFEVRNYRKAMFVAKFRNVALADSPITISVREATDIAGATARNINDALTTPNVVLTPDVAGCIPGATAVTLQCNTVLATQEVVINGVTLTARAAYNEANREYDQSAGDAATGISLRTLINAVFPDLVATDDGAGVVTIQAREPGAATVTVTGITDATTLIPTTVEVMGYIEVDASDLSTGWDRLVFRVTPGANAAAITGDVTLIRGNPRYAPVIQ